MSVEREKLLFKKKAIIEHHYGDNIFKMISRDKRADIMDPKPLQIVSSLRSRHSTLNLEKTRAFAY